MHKSDSHGQRPRRKYTPAQRAWHCRKFDEAQDAYVVTPGEYARAAGICRQLFYRWLRRHGVEILHPKADSGDTRAKHSDDGRLGYWRHGGLCTERADRNGIGADE